MVTGTPSWQLAHREITLALRSGAPALVLGEVGAGKTHLVIDAARSLWHDLHISVLDSSELDPARPLREQAAAHLLAAAEHEPTRDCPTPILILRAADKLPPARVKEARELLRNPSITGHRTLIMVTGEIDDGQPAGTLQQLLPYFSTTVLVPPLRRRRSEFPTIVRGLMEELQPGSFARLAPATLASLAEGYWPGNLHQLRAALRSAIVVSAGGHITGEQLPQHARQGMLRRLSMLELVERRTIIRILYSENGNRTQAARVLGISRATLYRKLREYGLE